MRAVACKAPVADRSYRASIKFIGMKMERERWTSDRRMLNLCDVLLYAMYTEPYLLASSQILSALVITIDSLKRN